MLLVVTLALGGLIVTWAAADPSSESDRSAITSPIVEDPTTTTSPLLEPVLSEPPIVDPLDGRVPGYPGTLVLAMGTTRGTQLWHWNTGPDAVLSKTPPIADLYDARPDPTGSVVAAVRRFGNEAPSLRMATGPEWFPVFWGAGQFAWHPTEPGAIAWTGDEAPGEQTTVHIGQWNGDGVYYRPLQLPGGNALGGSELENRLVAFDRHGLVFERRAERTMVRVERIDALGTTLGSVDGVFVGSSPDGVIAVSDGFTTRLVSGESLTQQDVLGGVYHSMVWADDGRIAAADRESTRVDLIDGSATRSVEVGGIGPAVLTWSPDGRFVVASGHAGEDPVLVFIDSATLDTTILLVSAHPVAAVALP